MINCDHCNMSFKYPCFLEKHLSRKIPCFMKSPPEFMTKYTNKINTPYTNEVHQKQFVNTQETKENHVLNTPFATSTLNTNEMKPLKKHECTKCDKQGRTKKHPCTKCDKTFYNRRDCENHVEKCKGCHVLQCPTCLKKFSSYSTKSEHIKNVKCKPHEPKQDTKNVQNNVYKCKPPESQQEPDEQPIVRKKITATVKLQIGASQSWRCNFCHDQLKSTYHIDHIIPICRGGTNAEDNLQALCVECHAHKTQKERQM